MKKKSVLWFASPLLIMEKHKCKLCARTFSNGRALGGHMKGHLAIHPLPKKPTTQQHHHQLGDRTDSASSSSSSSGEEQKLEKEKSLVYGLRENPKKSFRFADPGHVVLDRESETESRNPTRKRSKRYTNTIDGTKKKPSLVVESPTEPEQVSSVSDTSPEERVATCLMMLSRDVWRSKKAFRSYCTLDEHERVCSETKKTGKFAVVIACNNDNNIRIFECPLCYRVFGSGQALGGHKRCHLLAVAANSVKFDNNLIDLNLPASLEDDEFSVVSDA